jgi:hypothetical protein
MEARGAAEEEPSTKQEGEAASGYLRLLVHHKSPIIPNTPSSSVLGSGTVATRKSKKLLSSVGSWPLRAEASGLFEAGYLHAAVDDHEPLGNLFATPHNQGAWVRVR